MKNAVLVPGAIIIGGLIIAIAIFFVRDGVEPPPPGDVTALRPVSPEEHIIGNPTASVTLVEYSDIDCAYCKQFHRTLTQLMTEYGPSGEVAWVYRHLPLVDIHPNSGTHAEAAECVAAVAGKENFWKFIDAVHTAAPGTVEFDPNDYDTVLLQLSIDEAAFNACMQEGRMVDRVSADIDNALAIGAISTPYTVVLIRGAEPIPVSGALPYAAMKQVIEEALSRAN